jgi:hypothetical protein
VVLEEPPSEVLPHPVTTTLVPTAIELHRKGMVCLTLFNVKAELTRTRATSKFKVLAL